MINSLILIVDDNFKNLQVLGSTLREAKFRTAIAMNGFEALDFVKEKLPDLILLDIMMPQMDGIEVCKRLKENPKTRSIPVIFLTAKTDENTIKQAFEIGGQDYITKPFKAIELLSRVETHLEIKKNRDVLEKLNLFLEEKVDRRTEKLRLANEKLSKLDKAKSDFLNLISHELRTPLNAIKGFSYIIKDAITDQKYLDFIEEINEAADKLVKISDISLLITSLQFDNFKIRNIRIKLDDFINDTIRAYCSKNKLDIARIVLLHKSDTELVEIESTLVSNALAMILDNAFRHSPENGLIHITAITENAEVKIVIQNEGDGFSEKALNQLFDFFSEKTLFSASGLGVGLATVKLIMDSISGNVTASNIENKGAEVSISFPI